MKSFQIIRHAILQVTGNISSVLKISMPFMLGFAIFMGVVFYVTPSIRIMPGQSAEVAVATNPVVVAGSVFLFFILGVIGIPT